MIHTPVLLKEVISFLSVKPGGKYIDATYGLGGHSSMILDKGGLVLGVDADPTLVPSVHKKGLTFVTGDFSEIKLIAEKNGFGKIDGALFDLGIGSHQLDRPTRGFSFQNEGPLDMRFNQDDGTVSTAMRIVNKYGQKDLQKVFWEKGEEKKYAKRLSNLIATTRSKNPITTTTALYTLIKSGIDAKDRHKAKDVARRLFQSLRIEVNHELDKIAIALPQALELLKPNGRLVVISFHSLEDRMVKHFFINRAKGCVCPPELPECRCDHEPEIEILTPRAVIASTSEIDVNSRARSAKLRAARKIK